MTNLIYLINDNGKTEADNIENFDISFAGDNNVVEIYCNYDDLKKFKNCRIVFEQSNGLAVINKTCYSISNMEVAVQENSFVLNENVFTLGFNAICKGNANCTIGNNTFIGLGTKIRTSDVHKLYDENGEWLNPPADVIIGNNVWIGQECLILKKTVIPDGCVVGARSLLNKKYEENNTLLTGSPAVIKKRNISWKP